MFAVENFYPHHSIWSATLSAKICPPPPTNNSTFFPFCVSTNTVLACCSRWTAEITFCVLFSSYVCLKTSTLTSLLLSKLCTCDPNIWTQCWWRHMSLALSTPVFGMGVLLAFNIWAFSWPAGQPYQTSLPKLHTLLRWWKNIIWIALIINVRLARDPSLLDVSLHERKKFRTLEHTLRVLRRTVSGSLLLLFWFC